MLSLNSEHNTHTADDRSHIKPWTDIYLTWELELRKSSSSSRQNEPISRTSTRLPESLICRTCIVWYRSDTIASKSSYKHTPRLWAKLIKSLQKTFSSSTTPSSNLIIYINTKKNEDLMLNFLTYVKVF